MQQHSGEGQPLFHSSRERIDLVGDLVSQVGQFEHIVDDGLALFARDAVGGGEEVEVFADVEIFVDAEEVGHVPDLFPDRVRISGDVDPIDLDRTVESPDQGRQHLDRRALACAVGTDEPVNLATRNLDRDTSNRVDRSVVHVEVFDRDDRSGRLG